MKKLLFILAFLISANSFGQFAKPDGSIAIPTYSFYRTAADSGVHIYQGSVNLYNSFWMKHDTVRFKSLATNYKLTRYKLKADSILNPGYFTNWKALQYRKLNDHDSLSTLQEKSYNSLTDKPTIHASGSDNQTSIVGITGTLAQFNTAMTDADFVTGGGTATGSNTGDNAVNSNYSGLTTNATHTGDVTGSGALTIASNVVGAGMMKGPSGTALPNGTTNYLLASGGDGTFFWNYNYGSHAYSWGNHAIQGYVTGTPWTGMGYVTGSPWTGYGYITATSLTGYATETWVGQQGYVTGTPWTGYGYVTGTPWTGYGYLSSNSSNVIGAGTLKGSGGVALPNGTAGYLLESAGDGTFLWDYDYGTHAYSWGNHTNAGYYLATNPANYITQAGARTAISLTTSGSSGAASYNNTTGVLNIPQYTGGSGMVWPTGSGIPIVVSGTSWGTTVTNNSANWNTAYGWGNHAGLYSLLSHTHAYLSLSGGTLTGALSGTSASFSSSISASDFCNSDIRLKNLIGTFGVNDFAKVSKVQFYKYTFKADTSKTVRYGVVAQEIEKDFPEMIHTDDAGIKSVNYIDLLILKIAELEERIKKLENEK